MSAAPAWLSNYAPDIIASDEAVALLQRRLEARRQSARRTRPLLFLALAFLVVWLLVLVRYGRGGSAPWFWAALATVLVTALVVQELARRADADVAAGLTQRVARTEHVGASVVLGRARVAAAAVHVVLGVGWSVALVAAGHAGQAAVVAGCLLVNGVSAALGLRRALDRRAVACDATSLAIDERLRSTEASAAVTPLLVTNLALGPAGLSIQQLPHGLQNAFLISYLLGAAMTFVATVLPRWRQRAAAGSQIG